MTEIFVSAGMIGASDNMWFLPQLSIAHALQRAGDHRGSEMAERRTGAFVSEHKVGETDIHVREEYALGGFHRLYVMTGSERIRDTAAFFEFASLELKNTNQHQKTTRVLDLFLIPWKPDADVFGEAAGMSCNGRVLDLVVTYCADGTFQWEIVDGCDRLTGGNVASLHEARRAAEAAARRAFIRLA